MKKILIFMLLGCFISTQALASGSPSAKQTYLKKNFTAPTTSNYDPMDIFGILTFLMQYSETTGKYNYEEAGLTWNDMAEAISGNPDAIFNKLGAGSQYPTFGWKVVGNSRVLYRFVFSNIPLTGIFDGKYFKNLTVLQISESKITSIDISKNTNLRYLYCHKNQLTSLDVSKNIYLWTLICNTNRLTSLDISKNSSLSTLDCNYNQLTSLDVSKNTYLQYLWCNNNRITFLNLTNNTNLNSLYCQENKLTSLDLSKNTYLQLIECSSNQLTLLNLPNNTSLVTLYCSSNKLTSLDVSKNPNLNYIVCSENQLKFSTLKGNFYNHSSMSTFTPQALLKGGTKGFFELIDLSSEFNINGTLTTFKWYNKATNQEVTMFAANGTFYASPANAGKTLICKMTNASYPNFTLEYEVTITNSMTQGFSAKTRDFKIPEGFTLTGPEAETSNLKIYPNPVTDVLKINTPSQIESVSIYDYSGNEVKKVSPVINKEVNLQGLSSGNYILTVKTNQGTITKKIIKK
ncbi:T9SS type A sorting domain-containing protein [Apibacter adventoris]|uniref:T9SS type A sorting domain-containing protein n=1 Tax=Apibacter adventoris TaxID=1679466 RepID=UPI000CF6FBA0|nr:T9SS type A sorting domain-containing protein [Apibacter adventoris]PQL93546.1 hypothetical protein C4S76_07835 [Apibacter adventoris]